MYVSDVKISNDVKYKVYIVSSPTYLYASILYILFHRSRHIVISKSHLANILAAMNGCLIR